MKEKNIDNKQTNKQTNKNKELSIMFANRPTFDLSEEIAPLLSQERQRSLRKTRSLSVVEEERSCWERFKPAFIKVPPGGTPLPLAPVSMASIAMFNCVLHMIILFPFLPQMLRSFHIPEADLARCAGYVSSSYFLGAFLSSNVWGFLSDYVGRRPIIILCTILTAISALFFGLSQDLTWAIIARVVTGLSNGIYCAAKATIGDVTDDSNQAQGQIFLSIGWSFSLMIAPFLGSLLADPLFSYPSLNDSLPECLVNLLQKYPFLLPNLTVAVFNIATAIFFFFKLEETRVAEGSSDSSYTTCDEDRGMTEEAPLLASKRKSYDAASSDQEIYMQRYKNGTARRNWAQCCGSIKSFFLNARRIFTGPVIGFIMAISIYSYCLIGTDEITPVWTALDPAMGGLNFTTKDIGILIGGVAPLQIIFNLCVSSTVIGKFGCKGTFLLGSTVCAFTLALLPLANLLTQTSFGTTAAILGSLFPVWTINRICAALCFMTLNIMTNNCCTKRNLGMVNGVATSISFLSRILSPLVCGIVLSWSCAEHRPFPLNHFLPFLTLILAVIISMGVMVFVPKSLNRQLLETISAEQRCEEESVTKLRSVTA